MKLLSTNTKLEKGIDGFLVYGLQLAPSDLSGVINVCSHASKGCREACLFSAGRGAQGNVIEARIRKTILFAKEREKFLSLLHKDIQAGIKKAKKLNKKLAIRLNTISDLFWENMGVIEKYPEVQFWDYTKIPSRMERYTKGELPENYHLTFSRSECNDKKVKKVLSLGGNVAVVFAVNKNNNLPKEWSGYKVVDGDKSDLRFKDPKNVIVGLRHKGKAKKDKSGFVVGV